jgi:MFS family permease
MGVRILDETDRGQRIVDAAALVAIVALTALPYVGRLGFYSDDWNLLAAFRDAEQSGRSVIGATLPSYGVRPVQGLYLGLLYDTFGLRPLGYHLVNTAVIAGCVALLYMLLLRLRMGRAEAFASTLVFALLPQLSTVRVWYASFQIPLSMAFALVAMHAQLSFERSRRAFVLAVSVGAACLSIGAYEIFAPLIAGLAAALLVASWRKRRDAGWQAYLGPVAVLAAVALCTGLKLLSDRLVDPVNYESMARVFLSPHYDWRISYGLNVFAALEVHFWFPLRDWSLALVRLASGRAGFGVTAICVAVAALCWWRVNAGSRALYRSDCLRLLILGIAAFVLGHATFLMTSAIMFAPTGIGNRVLVAGAVGAAMILVALAGFLSSLSSPACRRVVLASLLAVVAAGAVARLEAIERYWAETPTLEQQVLDAARTDLAELPAGATVILDGICAYHGPAILFENDWDTGGALAIVLNRRIGADVVSPRMSLSRTGLDTSIYDFTSHYPFGPTLFAYNPRLHLLVPLTDAAIARHYFSRADRRPFRCPTAYVGIGVPV